MIVRPCFLGVCGFSLQSWLTRYFQSRRPAHNTGLRYPVSILQKVETKTQFSSPRKLTRV
jgi:hypothetical protein